MPNGIRKQVALTGFPTSHGAPTPAIIDPLTGSPTTQSSDGRSLALVGPTLVVGHVFGNQFHAPNPVQAGSGTKTVTVDGIPVAFVGDVFN